jgi:hypothetical protein
VEPAGAHLLGAREHRARRGVERVEQHRRVLEATGALEAKRRDQQVG